MARKPLRRRPSVGFGALLGPWLMAMPAEAVELAFPVDCTLGEDCAIQSYVHVGGADALDYRCGPRSYAGHKGTDFRIRDRAALAQGVAVLAAAPGTVRGTRDGMADVDFRTIDRETLRGRDCGNGIVVDHADGWSTQYCHLRKGSVAVRQGDTVSAGQRLGLVGLSGNTAFPHLHLTVRRGDTVIDPFTGAPRQSACGKAPATEPLWRETVTLPYVSAEIFGSGFRADTPSLESVNADTTSEERIAPDSPTLFFWARILGLQPRHRLALTITAPDGSATVESRPDPVDRPKAQWVSWAGKRRPAGGWPKGRYTGTVTLSEGGRVVMRDRRTVEIR